MTDEHIRELALEWFKKRTALLALSLNEPTYRKFLNELSEAENNLAAACRTLAT